MDGGGDNQISMRYFAHRSIQEMQQQRMRFEQNPEHAAEYQHQQRIERNMEYLIFRALREARGRRRPGRREERVHVIVRGENASNIGGGDGLDIPHVDVHVRDGRQLTLHDDSGFESGSEGD